ncbi:hypothetical protein F2Q69_00007641 [Brassica cretica]|uniref:Uncharacterized protein n=1 Tax=Brassica cretica TaxID=69181 RepID=A0A8S9P0E2_BRACR|nr:hypothetical protein F2Q69_00007641 [Brassica cretica]
MDGGLSSVRLSSSFDTRYISELSFQCHRFEVNPTVRSEVMHVLLRSGQSVLQERAVDGTNGLSIDGGPLPSVDGDARICIDRRSGHSIDRRPLQVNKRQLRLDLDI